MTLEDTLRNRIRVKYGTIKDFAAKAGLNYETVKRAISTPGRLENMNAGIVVKMFQLLDLDINESGLSGIENPLDTSDLESDEKDLIRLYRRLGEGSKKFFYRTGLRLEQLMKADQDVLLIPIRQLIKKEEDWEEIPYLPQAAGMGLGSHAEEYPIQETIRCKASQIPDGTDFVILAEGDSMEPKFHDGDKLFVRKTDWLDPGDIGLVYFEGDEMVKVMGNGCLESINKKYPPIDITYDPDSFFIHGKVLGKMK